MPTYEYVCDACDHEFEELQSFSEAPLKLCPKCKKKKLHRLIGAGAAIIFKGAGFYQTDYRSESYKSAAKAEETKASGDKPAAGDKGKTTDSASNAGAPASNPTTSGDEPGEQASTDFRGYTMSGSVRH